VPLSPMGGGEWGWGLEKQTAKQRLEKETFRAMKQAAKCFLPVGVRGL